MPLPTGSRLGPYEIQSPLGAGGMGEVYRARDTKLNREVAIKVLPESVSRDPDHLARFKREAQVLASLNHPHIAQIYGLEESDGICALVMELVEGDTLADRLARPEGRALHEPAGLSGRPIPLAEALAIARQIAEALEAAHESGIIHRDLKPANVKVRADGTVKVLDFGLAKAFDPTPSSSLGLTNSPTLSLNATHAGLILGTAAYMSPEQAAAKPVDKRADIWSFGVVLWEMLTGERLFDGETISHTLADVLRAEIDFAQLPPDTSAPVRGLLRRCLDRDVKGRLRDIGEARIALARAIAEPLTKGSLGTTGPAGAGRSARLWRLLPWGVAAAALVVAGTLLLAWAPWRLPFAARPMRVSVQLGSDVSVAAVIPPSASLALSPDGEVLAFVGQKTGAESQLYIRRLNQWQAVPLPGTESARDPFFAPDGQWVAFFAGGKLKKIAVTGGAAVTLSDAGADRGGAWGDDGTIAFAPDASSGVGLMRVLEVGGKAEALTKLVSGEQFQRWPQLLRGGKAVMFTSSANASGNYDDGDIVVQTLPNGARKIVQRGGYFGRYVASGHLVYVHGGTLFAAPFDLDRLEVAGQPVPVLEQVNASTGVGSAQFAVADNGTAVYLQGRGPGGAVPIVWMDRDGKTTPLRSTPADWSNPRFSPDGTRLAIDIAAAGGQPSIWVSDWARDGLTRLTFGDGAAVRPVWTPDGHRVVFTSTREGAPNLFWQRVDGTGDVQRLSDHNGTQVAGSWHPSGKFLAFHQGAAEGGMDLMILPMEGDEASGWKPGKPMEFLKSPFNEQDPMFSPNGRWIAYNSNETGRNEVYVQPFRGPGGKQQVSTDGGSSPLWSRSRDELFFATLDNQIMVAGYAVEGDSFHVEKPRLWSPGRFRIRPRLRSYDLHPDGNRFALASVQESPADNEQNQVRVIVNFFDELRRIAPAKR